MKNLLLLIASFTFGVLNAQIESGIVAHFPLNGNYNDVSNSAIVASNFGTTFSQDRNFISNQAVEFDGDDYISFNNNAVKTNLPITISAWVKLNTLGIQQIIFASDQIFNNYYGYWMQATHDGSVAVNFGAGLGSSSPENRKTFITSNKLTAGTWYHVVGIIKAHNDMTVFIDCVKQNGSYNGTGSTTIAYSSSDSKIGAGFKQAQIPDGHYFNGSIDQLVIWNRAISPSEIEELCSKRNTLSTIELEKAPRELMKIINILGQEVEVSKNTPLIYIYSDGTTEKIVITE